MPDAPFRKGQSKFVSLSRVVNTRLSLTGGGQLDKDHTITLVNDADPAPFSYYGTDIFGERKWLGVFGPSGNLHAAGLVPDPPLMAGSSKFLREDGLWALPPTSGGGGAVTSVFGRTGAVTALQSDYDSFFLTPAEGNAAYSALGHTHTFASITSKPTTLAGYGITDAEHSLGNPSVDGYILSSTMAGVRSWIAPAAGGTGGGKTEVYSDPNPPLPLADYLIWIDTDAPDASSVAGSDKNYVHNQVSPSTSWSVSHGLGKYPSVDVVDSGQSVIIPDVTYIDTNNVTLGFGAATSGKAYFN
jgi:hypothetical protein